MKEKIQKYFFAFWVIGFGVLILITFFSSKNNSAYEVTNILIREPYLCKKTNTGYLKVAYFKSDDDMFICGNVTSENADFNERIAQYIFIVNDENDTQNTFSDRTADYYSLIWFSSDDYAIPVKHYLPLGKYAIKLVHGRNVICIINFEVK